ncbi:MAG: M13 family metallopeptidase [Kofleriaceae bacterium]
MHRRLHRPLLPALGIALAACRPPQAPPPAPAPAPAATPTPAAGPTVTTTSLAAIGLEAASLDRAVDPCTDFYQFACGGWLAANPIPPDQARWGRFGEIAARNRALLRQLLEDARAAADARDASQQALGDYYQACMDTTAIEARGLVDVQPLLELARGVRDATSAGAALTELHRRGIVAAFGPYADVDRADPTVVALHLDAGGLGLPDRAYYLSDELAAKRAAYQAHLTRTFQLVGQAPARARRAAAAVMALETQLATLTPSAVDRRDDAAVYNPTSLAELARLAPTLDWPAYLRAIGAPTVDRVVVTSPAYLAGVARLLRTAPAAQWSAYVTIRVLDATSAALPQRFDDEAFALAQVLSGVEARPARWERCVDATADALPDDLGRAFVGQAFAGDAKAAATGLVEGIVAALDAELAEVPWMSAATKQAARAKLHALTLLIGYPDTWRTDDITLDPATYAANLLATMTASARAEAAKAGAPVDRTAWRMPAFMTSAYYDPGANVAALPAGILQPPFFDRARPPVVNLGSIGMMAGHEVTHGFDDSGARYDGAGRLVDWWQPDDLARFTARGACLAAQYGTFEALPGKFVDGALTNGENIADAGGVKLAFAAYRALRAGATAVTVADGFTEDQQFFLALGQSWCMQVRPDEARRRLAVDPHAPPKFRINGVLRNLPAFAAAFGCPVGSWMRPRDTCAVW